MASSSGVIRIIPVDHASSPLDCAGRRGVDTLKTGQAVSLCNVARTNEGAQQRTSRPDTQLDASRGGRVICDAVNKGVGLGDRSHCVTIDAESEGIFLPIHLERIGA